MLHDSVHTTTRPYLPPSTTACIRTACTHHHNHPQLFFHVHVSRRRLLLSTVLLHADASTSTLLPPRVLKTLREHTQPDAHSHPNRTHGQVADAVSHVDATAYSPRSQPIFLIHPAHSPSPILPPSHVHLPLAMRPCASPSFTSPPTPLAFAPLYHLQPIALIWHCTAPHRRVWPRPVAAHAASLPRTARLARLTIASFGRTSSSSSRYMHIHSDNTRARPLAGPAEASQLRQFLLAFVRVGQPPISGRCRSRPAT